MWTRVANATTLWLRASGIVTRGGPWREATVADSDVPQQELVLSTKWTSQPEPIEAQDALEMCEQHLDLFPFTSRPDIGIGLRDVARNISGLFVD